MAQNLRRVFLSRQQAFQGNECHSFILSFLERLTGTANVSGNEAPRFPELSGAVGATYEASLNDEWAWFWRGDVSYFGEAWTDEANLAKTEDYFLTNMSVGVQSEDLRLELFARNLFDEDAWAAGARNQDFSIRGNFDFPGNHAIILSPQDKRTVGVRLIKDF